MDDITSKDHCCMSRIRIFPTSSPPGVLLIIIQLVIYVLVLVKTFPHSCIYRKFTVKIALKRILVSLKLQPAVSSSQENKLWRKIYLILQLIDTSFKGLVIGTKKQPIEEHTYESHLKAFNFERDLISSYIRLLFFLSCVQICYARKINALLLLYIYLRFFI